MPNPERARAIRAHHRAVRRSAQKAAMAQPVLHARMSRAQITIGLMRRNGTLHQLIGDGQLDEQDLEAEWQHKLETSPDWQEKMDKMTSHQKKNFLRHRRDAFVEVIREAFARAQAKVDAGRLVPAHDGSKDSAPSSEVGDEDEGNELTGALTKFRQDRLRELDGFQQEPSHEISRAPTTFVHQGLSEKECEALALAMFQQNRMRRDNPNQELGSQERVEAQAPARGAEECKQQSGGSKGNLLHLVLRRRKKERKLDADQKEFESKKEALGDASASSVWQAVKNFGNYMFSFAHPVELKPAGTRDC